MAELDLSDPFASQDFQDIVTGRPEAVPTGEFDGQVEAGNIDLTKRPKVKNEDGSISTVRSSSFNIDGKEVLIPTVAEDGSRILSNEEALEQYKRTGKHLGKFATPEDATKYAEELHKSQEQYYADRPERDRYATDQYADGGSWWDLPLTVASRTAGIGGDLSSTVRALGESQEDPDSKSAVANQLLGKFGQELFDVLERGANDAISPTGRRDIESTISDPNFWSLNALALKAANTAPDIVAAVIPAVVTKNVLASAAMGGTLSAAAMVDDLYKQTDALDDTTLQEAAPMYKEMRSKMDERAARMEYNAVLRSYRPLIAGMFGAVTNAWTPGGQVAGKLLNEVGEEVAEGVIKRTTKGAAEGAISETAQEGTEATLTQQGLIAGGLQDEYDVAPIIEQALGGGVIGGILGGGVSALPNRRAVSEYPQPTSNSDIDVGVPPAIAGDIPPASTEAAVVTQPAVVDPNTATTAQDMQSIKYYKKNYANLTDKQKQMVDARLTSKGLPVNKKVKAVPGVSDVTVKAAGGETVIAPPVQQVVAGTPDPAQVVAIAATKPVVTTPPVVTPVVTPPVVEQPIAQPQTTETVTPPVAETGVNMPVEPEVAVPPTEVVEPSPAPAVAQPTPIEVEPVAPPAVQEPEVRTGPRILVDKAEEARIAKETEKALGQNIKAMNTPVAEPVGAKLSKAQIKERDTTRDTALEIAGKHVPTPAENDIFTKKPEKRLAAMKLIKARADAMMADVKAKGIKLPEKFKDTANAAQRYNPETLIMIEAKRLASLPNPKTADFERFVKREFDLRAGALDEVLADRREEGDRAKKAAVLNDNTAEEMDDTPVDMSDEVNEDDVADQEAAAEDMSPEDEVVARQEERERVAAAIDKKSKEVPDSVEEAMDKALDSYTVPKADRKAPVIEQIKKRTFTKPTQKEVDKAAKPMDAASRKKRMDEVFAKKREAEEAVKQKIEDLKAKKVTPKVTEIKERVEAAREKTNTAPTEAQKVAGNYAKGRVSVQGIEVALENPKGSERTGTTIDGDKWSVKMKNDYGYIVGTKGADDDPVDVFIGPVPDSPYVFVIDQKDLDTEGFDEHKVMLGFKDEQQATRAYIKAFSDDMGAMRIGNMTRMTVPEFKAWLEKSPEDRYNASLSATEQAASLMLDNSTERSVLNEFRFQNRTREGYIVDPITKRAAQALQITTAQEVMWKLDFSHLSGINRAIAGTMRTKLTQLVGDTKVYIADADDVNRLTGRAEGDVPPYGYHVYDNNSKLEFIVINANIMNDPAKLAHTIIHEVVHAATVRSINANPVVKQIINQLLLETKARVNERGAFTDMERWVSNYAFTNAKEFIAEAMSNKGFQDVLAKMELTPAQAASLKLGEPVRNMWGAFLSAVRRALGLPKNTHTMLEAAIRATEFSMASREDAVAAMDDSNNRSYLTGNPSAIKKSITDTLKQIETRRDLAPTNGNPQLMGLRTLDNIARAADRYFGNNPVVRKVVDIVEGMRVAAIKEVDRAAPIIQKLHDMEKKYKGQQWEDFTSLVHDETMSGVYADRPLADQKHITKEGASDSWQRAQYPDLARRYAKLPADLRQARKEAMDFFRAKQNEMSLKLIRNRIVTLFDTPDPDGLAQRILDKTVTDADKKLMGEAYDAIAAAGVLSRIDGPYVPLMRRGNFVVKGTMKVTTPGNSRAISDNEFEFKDKKAAAAFAASQQGRPTMRTIYVDKDTGSETGTENGSTVRLTAEDMNAEARYRVVVQNRHVEMFDTLNEARDRVAELRAKGMDVDDAVPRSFENYGIQSDALSTQMRKMNATLERRADERKYTFEQKQDLMRTLNEMSLQMLGSTRIQSRALPRRYVAGASKDFVRNTTDYAHSAGNYIAKLDWRPKLDAALENLDDAVKEMPKDGFAQGRTAIQNEIVRRVTTSNPIAENKTFNALTSRILSMSFIDKLMSPSYSVINAAQPMMITTPYLAAHYGAMRAYGAMARAYNDIGSMSALKEGLASTLQKARRGDILPTDPVSLIKSRLKSADEKALIDILVERGIIDTDSGLEVSQLVRANKGIMGKLDGGIGYLEGIARQMPKTIEAMNRTVSALAAYRLEMERSGDKARAIQFAQDTINLTQFNYSASNTAPIMNHPALRLALQFKKYGLGMYQFLGEQSAIMLDKTKTPQERKAALKALSYTIAMHVLVAGAMGLPTEPIKLIVTAANGLGVMDWNWQDVENEQRRLAADLFGAKFGEIVSRGVPRALGIDLSSRMGIDTLMGPLGEPRSNEAQDWKAYAWDSLSGAPVGLVADWAKGVNDLAQGDFVRAAERLVPVKAFSDSVKAYRTMTEGNVSERTGKQVMSPYSVSEGLLRATGFGPAREAESFEQSSTFYRNKDYVDQKTTEFKRAWVEATGAARGRLWKDVQKFNRGLPPESRVKISDLRDYQRKMKRDMKETVEGIKADKRDRRVLDRLLETYNAE